MCNHLSLKFSVFHCIIVNYIPNYDNYNPMPDIHIIIDQFLSSYSQAKTKICSSLVRLSHSAQRYQISSRQIESILQSMQGKSSVLMTLALTKCPMHSTVPPSTSLTALSWSVISFRFFVIRPTVLCSS